MSNLNIFLRNESIFSNYDTPLLDTLEQNGITTIKQLLTLNVNTIKTQTLNKTKIRGIIDLLNYKYHNQIPFTSFMLNEKITPLEDPKQTYTKKHFTSKHNNINLYRMGFSSQEIDIILNFINKTTTNNLILIEIFNNLNIDNEKIKLYISSYYNQEKQSTNNEINELTKLKIELTLLEKMKQDLDKQISETKLKINLLTSNPLEDNNIKGAR